jgi:putative SOS response-associated peptidase YedK
MKEANMTEANSSQSPDVFSRKWLLVVILCMAKRIPKPEAGSMPVYKFEMPDGAPYALAGLFSEWRPRKGSPHLPLDTFSIVTTEANELMEPIHDRMPVILHPRDYDRWLTDYDESRPPIDLLRPYEADAMRVTPANRLVGNVRNNGPEMLNPCEEEC